ncbi:MAG: type II toxin-antitoxin system PemK/MazF family toxin [Magnetospirillum sp.]|nr:type II toxin-antitoxin system PemK/MazF family toxin [Magnetospirillum sp.]
MAFPDPKPGLVVRYDYVWTHEAATGREQGKDRPTCLVAASDATARPRYVVLLPITHTPPSGDTVGIEIPARVKLAIGLDDEPSWVIVSEHNIDEWPNGGLSPVPGKPGEFSYGFIPPGLFAKIKASFLELVRAKRSGAVRR